jgi:eukaryotic-like serine/threonine-protein kinase
MQASSEGATHHDRTLDLPRRARPARPGQAPDPDIKVRTLLDRASEKIVGKFNQQPRVEVAIRRTIGDTYVALGLFPSADTHLEQSLAVAGRELGYQHPDTLNTMVSLAALYKAQGKYAQAEPLIVAAHYGLRRVQGEEHPDSLRAMGSLANVCSWRGDFSKAESLLVSIVDLYDAWGKKDKADAWRKLLETNSAARP